MHHSEPSGSPGSRRLSHPSLPAGRRGSGATVPPDEPSASPGHHPPHSLSLQSAGTQVKKKSGFQITSVLPAQVSVSANNSMADDTESYDDLDESHTEDLSSSDLLDASASRATDTGVPERSSSEETLNSLHGGETPGVASPNEPVLHTGYMVNGVHTHQHKPVQGRPAALSQSDSDRSGRFVPLAPVESGRPTAPTAPAPAAPESVSAPAPAATTATSAATASRFRVVKLDSSSEPFRKGRWTCTEYYEKDGPPGDAVPAAHRAVEGIFQPDESASGSSSGSTVSGGGGDVPLAYGAPHAHPPDPQPLLLPAESQPVPARTYSPANTVPASGIQNAALPAGDFAPMPVHPTAPLHVAPGQSVAAPRAAPVPIGIPLVTPRAQMGIPQGSALNTELSASQLASFANLLPMPAGQRAPVPPSYVTAAQLEDAQRLLLQHHPLLALPRLAAGGMAGLAGAAAPDAVAALGQEGGAGAFAASAGADDDSSSGASVVAIDNKIEQAMDLVKSHLMYAVREEVEVLKEQIKELLERNAQLEQENALLKNLASPEQLLQFQTQVQSGSPTAPGPTA